MLSCGCHMYKVNWQIVRLPLSLGSWRGPLLQKQHGRSKQISWLHLYSASWMRRIQTNYRLYLYNASWMRRISAMLTGPLAIPWRYLIAFSLVAISCRYLLAFSPVLSRYLGDLLTISACFTIIATLMSPWLVTSFISQNLGTATCSLN